MGTPSGLFGGNSDGSANMEDWLSVMCAGCKHDRGRGPSGGMGGMSCPLPGRAYSNPYADIPEWTMDAAEVPERLLERFGVAHPVCTAYVPRKTRSDAGTHRGPRVPAGQEALL